MLEIDSVAERLTAARDDRYAEVLEGVDAHAAAHGCGMEIPSAAETRMLSVLVRATRATYVLEIGGGIGYSALHMTASFGQTGRLDVVEPNPVHATLIQEHARRFALAERIRVQNAAATSVVMALSGPYDLIAIHAEYVDECGSLFETLMRLLRVGGSLVVLAGRGRGADGEASLLAERLAEDPRVWPAFSEHGGMMAARVR